MINMGTLVKSRNSYHSVEVEDETYHKIMQIPHVYNAGAWQVHLHTDIYKILGFAGKNAVFDKDLKVYEITHGYIRDISTVPQSTEVRITPPPNESGYSSSSSLSIPSQKIEASNILVIEIKPLIHFKCMKQYTCIDGVILCESCKEVLD